MQMQVDTEKEALLRKISSLGLAVYDTKLYLDTHDCPEAREYMYSKYIQMLSGQNDTYHMALAPAATS